MVVYVYLFTGVLSSEHQGMTPQIYKRTYDSKLPLNLNHSDLFPDSNEAFTERIGFANTAFFLARCELNVRGRKLMHNLTPGISSIRSSIDDTTAILRELNT
jgi:hypothetical protein